MTDAISSVAKPNAFIRGVQFTRSAIAHFFVNDYQIWGSFLIPCLLLLLVYFCFGVYPVGKESVLSLDLNGQYVYYYDYMYDVFAGKESLFYSWSRNLSGEFMGIIGYYLASPFNFLVWAFPREMITEGLLTMMVVKVGAIGFTMSAFLTYRKGLSKHTVMVFAPLYALCSYVMVQTMNPMWLDGVMALPLVVWGIEALIEKGRFRLLAFSLIYSFVTCFYIGFMIAIFTAIYFVYYYAASKEITTQNTGTIFGRIGLMFMTAVSSVLCSCFMLLPVVKSLSLGKFEFSTPDYSLATNFNILDALRKLLPNSYDTVRMTGMPFIYCGTIVTIMLVAYFFCNKFRARERIAGGVLIALMFACMYVKPVDMLWHGGQLPNWLPQRYSFMISFLFVLFAAKAFDKIAEIKPRDLGIITAGIFGFYLYLEGQDYFMSDLGNSGRDVLDGISVILPAMLVLAIIGGAVITLKDKLNRRSVRNAFIILVCCELFYNTLMAVVKQDIDIVYSTRPSYRDVIDPTREVVSQIKENDDGFYRIEKTFFRSVNDPLALNMYGLSHSSSTLNAKPINMLGKLGFTSRSHYTRASGLTELTADLFGVKYILSTSDNSTSSITDASSISVAENTNAMPLAYLVDKNFSHFNLIDDDPFASQNQMLSAMLGETETQLYFKRVYETDLVTENVTQGTADGHHSFKVVKSGQNAQLEYTIRMPATSPLYMFLPSGYERTVNVWVNKEFEGVYFETDNYCIKKLGDFSENEAVDLILTLTKDNLYFREAQFVYLDEALLNESIEKLHQKNAETVVERISGTNIKITVNSDQQNLLYTTIPDEEGWKITIDGEEANHIAIMEDSLIAIPVSEGKHVVEMKFTTASYPLALIATGAGAILLAIMIFVGYKVIKPKQKKLDTEYSDDEIEDNEEELTNEVENGERANDTAETESAEEGEDNADML